MASAVDETCTDLELLVIERFCRQEGRSVPSLNDIRVIERDRSAVGFMTDIQIRDLPARWKWSRRAYDSIPGAIVGGVAVGFVIFFENESQLAIEGFTYGETWPESEYPILFLDAKNLRY